MIKPVSADMAGEKTITQWLPSGIFRELFSMFFYRMKKTKVINVETFKWVKIIKELACFQ